MKPLTAALIAGGFIATLGLPAPAADQDASVYDKNPECMNRDTSADNVKCVAPSDQTGRRRIFSNSSASSVTKGSGTVTSGGGGTGGQAAAVRR